MEAIQLTTYSREMIAEKYRLIVQTAAKLAREGKISLQLAQGAEGHREPD